MEQYLRATEQITGSAAAAQARIEDLVEIANLPGLQFEALTKFSNQFIAVGLAAEDVDKILLGTGQTVVSLGGTAANAELAVTQLLQAFRAGKVDMRGLSYSHPANSGIFVRSGRCSRCGREY